MKHQIPIKTILFCIFTALALSSNSQQLRIAHDWNEDLYAQKPDGPNGVVPLVLDSFFCSEYNLFTGLVSKQTSGYYIYQNDDQQLLFTNFERDTAGMITSGQREQNFYNAQGNKIATIRQILIAGEWYDHDRDTFIYSPAGELKEVVSQQLEGGLYWTNYNKGLYSYDGQGKLDTLTGLYWDKSGQKWVNGTLAAYDFTANDLLLLRRYYVWKPALDQWGIDDEEKNIYHPDGRKLAYYHSRAIPDGNFRLETRDTFLYDNNNLNDSIISVIWDDTLAQYRIESISTFQYDQNGNRTFGELHQWEAGELRPKQRALIVPGDNIYSMVPAETIYQFFDSVDSTWNNATRQKNAFTLLDNQVVKEHYSYEFIDFNQVDWNITIECDYYYHLKTSPVRTPDSPPAACAIPNPYLAGSKCRCGDESGNGVADIRVFDLSGRLVVHLAQVDVAEFALPVLPAGVYVFAMARNGQTSRARKIFFTGQ